MNRSVSPPSGMVPPGAARTPSGVELDLVALAEEVCTSYDAEFPDERERYGPAGMQWCRHDNQHLLNWAVLSLGPWLDFERQVDWLAGVLDARDFPLPRLARDLDLLANAVARSHPSESDLHARLAEGAAFVRTRSGSG